MNELGPTRNRGMAESPTAAGGEGRGTNQLGMRMANERLILALVRRHPGLAKAEIARLTGLTPQATTIIVNRLEADGLLSRSTPMRGRVGQPAIPYSLAADGAFSIGLLIGRRGCDLIVMDFVAGIRKRLHLSYRYPLPGQILDFVVDAYARLLRDLTPDEAGRLTGFGIATPFELWNWETHLKAPPGAMAVWREIDIAAELSRRLPLAVQVCNDANAACGAELTFGDAQRYGDFLYVFVSTFVGGGLVLDGKVVFGRTGNAGAIGSLPVPDLGGHRITQLIDWASIQRLEDQLRAGGRDVDVLAGGDAGWSSVAGEVDRWIEEFAPNVAMAGVAAAAFFEIEAIVIDGAFPPAVRERVRSAVARHVADFDPQGITAFDVAAGSLGADAPVLGAAALPFLDFARDPGNA